MSDHATTPLGPNNYAGAMVRYQQPAPDFYEPPPDSIDAYEPSSKGFVYRYAEPEEIATGREAMLQALDYFATSRLWGRSVLFAKSCVAERFRELIGNMAFGDVMFVPEEFFDMLDIHESRQVKSTRAYLQNLIVDRNKEDADHHRESRLQLEGLLLWSKCVDEVTCGVIDNPNARVLCSYTDWLIEGAQAVLSCSEGSWASRQARYFQDLRASLSSTIDANEMAYRNVYGAPLARP